MLAIVSKSLWTAQWKTVTFSWLEIKWDQRCLKVKSISLCFALLLAKMFISVRWKLWKLWSAAITKWLCQTASIPRTEWEGHTSLMFDDRKPKFNLYNLDIASQLKNAVPRMKLGNHALTQHFTCAQATMCCVRWWLASQLDPTLQAWAKWALLMGKRSGAAGTSRWPALETTTPTAFTEDVHKNKSTGESGSHWSQTRKQS